MRPPRSWWIFAFLLALLAGPGRADEDAKEPRFEVLVVGTIHAPWLFRSAKFHPGHVRAALEAAKPDVVGVESNPEWFAKGIFHDVTYEAQGVAVPWAKTKGIPVYGIDWMDVQAWESRTDTREKQRAGALRGGGLSRGAFGMLEGAALERAKAYFDEVARKGEFRLVNDIGSKAHGEEWLAGAGKLTPFGGHRNHEIARRCVSVMNAHPGKRLVVVIGAAHKAILDELFRRRGDVRVLSWEEDVPAPTDADAEAALTQEDRVVILGHNLDGERSYFHALLLDLERMALVLAAYRRAGGEATIADYFTARHAAHRGMEPSLLWATLAKADVPRDRLYPYPLDHWRMAYDLGQAARLEAHQDLEDLARELPEPAGGHGPLWRRAFLAKAYPRYLCEPTAAPGRAWTERWSAHDPAHGPLSLVWDADAEALRVRLTEREGAGLPYLAHTAEVSSRTLVFTARVRATGVEALRVVAYVWPEGSRAVRIAEQAVSLGGDEWSEILLRLDVPEGLTRVGVNVYADRCPDGTLWFADARVVPLG